MNGNVKQYRTTPDSELLARFGPQQMSQEPPTRTGGARQMREGGSDGKRQSLTRNQLMYRGMAQ
jgi:hypothetical protein